MVILSKLSVICTILSLNFWSFNDRFNYEDSKSHPKYFYHYFQLTSKKKCVYTRPKLVGESSYLLEGNLRLCRFWCHLQALFRTRYAPYLLTISNYFLKSYLSPSSEPTIEQVSLSKSKTKIEEEIQELKTPKFEHETEFRAKLTQIQNLKSLSSLTTRLSNLSPP